MMKVKPSGISTILILGVMAILVTIIVPLLSRTVVDVRISKQQEEQARAFSAAESGLEKAIIGGQREGKIGENVTYQVSETGLFAPSVLYIYPKAVEKNQPITVWLISHQGVTFDPDAPLDLGGTRYNAGTLDLYWGDSQIPADSDLAPAIEGTLFYRDGVGNLRTRKYLYDPNSSRRTQNNFSPPSGTAGYTLDGHQFHFWSNLASFPCAGLRVCYALRLRLLYNDDRPHPLALQGSIGQNIPPQGECLESLATVQTSGISSRVKRCLFYRDFPAIFDFVLYSDTTLEKTVP